MPQYTEDELFKKLERADAAGDVEAAKVIADEIRSMRAAPAPAKASFSGVKTSISQSGRQPSGPLAESPSAAMQPDAPSIDSVNASNRAYRASPQRLADQEAFDARQAEIKKADFAALPAPARLAIGAGSRVGAAGRGVGQLVAAAQDAASPRAQTLPGLVSGNDGSRYSEAQRQEVAARKNDEYMAGDTAANVGKVTGDVAMTAIPLSKVSGATTFARAFNSALAGGVFGGLQPTVEGESRAQNTAIGGAFGAAGQLGSEVLAASGKRAAQAVTPELRKAYQYARSLGINLTPAQLTDSEFLKRAAAMADKLPFSGAAKRREEQNAAGNRGLLKLIGGKGETLDASTFGAAADKLGKKFDRVFAGGTKFDETLARKLAEIKQEADATLDDTARRTIDSLIGRLKEQADNWQIHGNTLQSLDMAARKAASGGGDRQQVAQAFRDALHDNFSRNAGVAIKKEWETIRRQYANLKTVESLVARHPEGGVPLTQLKGAVNSTQTGRKLMARGKAGALGELAKIGSRMKGPSSSGTAENLQAGGIGAGLLGAPLQTLGLLSTGAIAGRVLNSSGLARVLMREGVGRTRQAIAPYVTRSGLAAGAGLIDSRRKTEEPKR